MTNHTSIDLSDELQGQVKEAYQQKSPLRIQGGNSKLFYGYEVSGDLLDVSGHQGVTSYEPSELVMTSRAGTPLKTIENILDEHNQMLAFEPPAFSEAATIGGTIACNLSGPRRPYGGAARDLLLGTNIVNGKGEKLSFGGEVMKNVAGYDVSRLMAGAMGTLGVILEVSLKTQPKPETELTLVLSLKTDEALKKIHQWSRLPLPISATCIYNQQLYVRLSGTDNGTQAAKKVIGGDELNDSALFWQSIKEQQHDYFLDAMEKSKTLWRLSLASNTDVLSLNGETLYEWGGALRWLITNDSEQAVRDVLSAVQGHAVQFRYPVLDNNQSIFQPISNSLFKIHQNLKNAFDPEGILNPGKMYKEL